MLNRQLADLVYHFVIGYFIILITFLSLSFFVIDKTENAGYIFVFISLFILTRLSEPGRNNFLKSIFIVRDYRIIRISENMITVLPFIIFLIFNNDYLYSALLITSSVILSLVIFESKLNITFPTPFSKHPFEFTAGFRNTFLLILISYFAAFKSVTIGNFNLGVISLIFIFLICSSYYSEVENEYYVWIFSKSPVQFIFYKIFTAFFHSLILCLPVIVGLCVFFPERFFLVIGILLLGFLYISTFVLSKYASFPKKLNLLYGSILAFCIWLPPLILFVIPFFYFRSVKNLNKYLEW